MALWNLAACTWVMHSCSALGKENNWKVFCLFQCRMQLNAETLVLFSDIFPCPAISGINSSLNPTAFSLYIILPCIFVSLCLLWDMYISCLSYICYPDEQCHGMRDPPNGLKFWHRVIGYNRWGCVHPKPKMCVWTIRCLGLVCLCLGLHSVHISYWSQVNNEREKIH